MVSASPSMEEVLCRYIKDVYRYLFFLCCDADLAEELTQETLCRALTCKSSFAGKSTVRTWLFSIARNLWVSTAKRRTRARVMEASSAQDIGQSRYGDEASAERIALEIDECRHLTRALGYLSDRNRALLVLREYWELPYAEIAQVMGMSVPAVKKNLHLARAALRQLYLTESGGG